MKRKHEIVLSVPQPCTQDWNKMSSTEQGRHCTNCNKTVIDFSNYTDRELAEFFKKDKGEVCGRINNYQANRPILITEQANRSIFHKLLYGTALASWLGIASNANAQSNNATTQTEQKKVGEIKKTEQNNSNSGAFYIEGIIIDAKTKQPLPFVNVIIRNKDIIINGIESDVDGTFRIKVPDENMDKLLVIDCVTNGYNDYTEEINPVSKTKIELGTIAMTADNNKANKRTTVILGRMDIRAVEPHDLNDTKKMELINVDSVKAHPAIKNANEKAINQ